MNTRVTLPLILVLIVMGTFLTAPSVRAEVLSSPNETLANHVVDNASGVQSTASDTIFPAIDGTVEVDTSLNIRTGPWGSIVGGFTNGAKVRIVGTNGPWYKIEYQGGSAYIHQNYVTTANKAAGQVPVVYPSDYTGPIVDGTQAGSSGGSNQPVPAAGDLQTRIVNAANALVGQQNFPYAEGTQGGALGCAQVVSTALKTAGALSNISLGVLSVMSDLKSLGWEYAQVPPYRAGDVITWKTYDYNGDGVDDPDTHIGIVVESGNSVQVMNNSSSQRMPSLCPANAMTLSHVLRKV
ncbi:MAG: SH3 domain-containing protein [Candidatus Ozemobacteraceae bacterium]